MKTIFFKPVLLLVSTFCFFVSMTPSDERNKSCQWDRYGVLCITNTMDFTMNYSYRWGNDNWSSISLHPGGTQRHWYEYKGHHTTSPDFTINFDHDQTSEEHYTLNSLTRYRSPDNSCDSAKKYNFEVDNDDNEIVLLSTN